MKSLRDLFKHNLGLFHEKRPRESCNLLALEIFFISKQMWTIWGMV